MLAWHSTSLWQRSSKFTPAATRAMEEMGPSFCCLISKLCSSSSSSKSSKAVSAASCSRESRYARKTSAAPPLIPLSSCSTWTWFCPIDCCLMLSTMHSVWIRYSQASSKAVKLMPTAESIWSSLAPPHPRQASVTELRRFPIPWLDPPLDAAAMTRTLSLLCSDRQHSAVQPSLSLCSFCMLWASWTIWSQGSKMAWMATWTRLKCASLRGSILLPIPAPFAPCAPFVGLLG
mmetsp:Transcript_12196/g.33849  ORF Transcript_12196/g.33849 Transcript_12196/m.33849 type:complete len:233 (+) Transcript_12196:4388-5086(+)